MWLNLPALPVAKVCPTSHGANYSCQVSINHELHQYVFVVRCVIYFFSLSLAFEKSFLET